MLYKAKRKMQNQTASFIFRFVFFTFFAARRFT